MMKELDIKTKEPIEHAKQVQVKKIKTRVGSLVPGDGHKLYEFNHTTLEIKLVNPSENKTVMFKEKKKLAPNEVYIPHDAAHIKFETKEGCSYVYSLNVKNAVKKIHKRFKNVPFVKEIISE